MLKLLRNLAMETLIPRLQRNIRGHLPREMKRRLLKVEAAIKTSLDKKSDYEGLKVAVETVEDVIGAGLRKLFPDYLPRNLTEGTEHLAQLQKWQDAQEELEVIVKQDANDPKVYKELWALVEKYSTEEYQSIPSTKHQDDLLAKCRENIENSAIGKVDLAARKALKNIDREEMKKVVAEADKLNHTSTLLMEIQQVLDEFDRIDEEASSSFQALDRKRMMKVLKDANVLKYSSDQLMEIELVVAKYEKVDNFCTDALEKMDKELLEQGVKDAEAINHTSDIVDDVIATLKLPEKEFVTKELEVANKESDEKRITHRTIRLLQIDLDENGSQWSNIQRYPKLKSPEDYAKAKMFGKAKLRDTFYVSNGKSVVIGSLQQSDDKAFKKQAIQFNKWILGYSGDKKAPEGPEQSLLNLLGAVASSSSDMERDEVFLQLIKHTTQHPTPENSDKAWEAFAVCCRYVKPSSELEKWLMMYIRKQAGDNSKKMLSAMNDAKYGNMKPPISASALSSVLDELKGYSETGSRFSVSEGEPTGPSN